LDNQSIERDRLIGIGFVLNFVKFISFTFGDKEMISVIEAIVREVFVKILLESFRKLSIRLQTEEQVELEKERVAQEEASRATIIEELDGIQAMIDADEQLAVRLQAEEQEQFSIEEKSRMLVEMIAERKKLFAAQRAAEQRRRSYEEIQKLFDKAYKQVSSFVPMDSEVVKSSVTRTEGSSKRTGDELESDKSKKQKIDEHVEAKKDDQEEAEMKRHIEIVKCKIDKDGTNRIL
ncbi:hypothetical protein Tco_0921616, partial [Tanacetum coccineum]